MGLSGRPSSTSEGLRSRRSRIQVLGLPTATRTRGGRAQACDVNPGRRAESSTGGPTAGSVELGLGAGVLTVPRGEGPPGTTRDRGWGRPDAKWGYQAGKVGARGGGGAWESQASPRLRGSVLAVSPSAVVGSAGAKRSSHRLTAQDPWREAEGGGAWSPADDTPARFQTSPGLPVVAAPHVLAPGRLAVTSHLLLSSRQLPAGCRHVPGLFLAGGQRARGPHDRELAFPGVKSGGGDGHTEGHPHVLC